MLFVYLINFAEIINFQCIFFFFGLKSHKKSSNQTLLIQKNNTQLGIIIIPHQQNKDNVQKKLKFYII